MLKTLGQQVGQLSLINYQLLCWLLTWAQVLRKCHRWRGTDCSSLVKQNIIGKKDWKNGTQGLLFYGLEGERIVKPFSLLVHLGLGASSHNSDSDSTLAEWGGVHISSAMYAILKGYTTMNRKHLFSASLLQSVGVNGTLVRGHRLLTVWCFPTVKFNVTVTGVSVLVRHCGSSAAERYF